MAKEQNEKKQGGIWFLLALAIILGAGTGLYWYIDKSDSNIADESTLIIENKEETAEGLKGATDAITEEDKELNQIITDIDSLEKDADPKNFDSLP